MTTRTGLPTIQAKLPNKRWPTPLKRSEPSSRGSSSSRASAPGTAASILLASHGTDAPSSRQGSAAQAPSSRQSRSEGGARPASIPEDRAHKKAEIDLLAAEMEETDKRLASNLQKQNALVLRRHQRFQQQSAKEITLEDWLGNGGRWSQGNPLPPPRWPSIRPNRCFPGTYIEGSTSSLGAPSPSASSAPGAMSRSLSLGSLPTPMLSPVPAARAAPVARAIDADAEVAFKTEDLLSWMRGIMNPNQETAAIYHQPLAPLVLTPKLREMRATTTQDFLNSFTSIESPSDREGGLPDADHEEHSQKDVPLFLQSQAKPGSPAVDARSDPGEEKSEETSFSKRPSIQRMATTACSLGEVPRSVAVEFGSGANKEPNFKRGLEVNRTKALEAFRRLSEGGEILADNLLQVLHYAGHPKVEMDTVNTLLANRFHKRSHLDREDFLNFIDYYEEAFRNYIQELFNKADANSSGSLSAAEISTMLRRLGLTPVPGVVQELISEVTGLDNGLAEVNVEQFVRIHDIIQDRAGFTAREVDKIKALFRRYDRDHSGSIDAKELRAALSWWGFRGGDEVRDQFIHQVDFDNSGASDFDSFLQIMRLHREHEVAQIRLAFGEADHDHSGTIDDGELPAVFEKLGYITGSPNVLRECTETCGFRPGEPLIFEDLYILVDTFRRTEGFLKSELEEIEEVFRRHTLQGADSIGGIELGTAVRWLGYPQTFEQVQEILEQFEIDDSGQLDFAEFLKMLRRYRELEVEKIHSCFETEEKTGTGSMSDLQLRKLLLSLGHTPTVKEVRELFKKTGSRTTIPFWELDGIVTQYRLEARERFRSNKGFADREVSKLRTHFARHDPSHIGCIENKHLANLLGELFPGAAYSLDSHARARELLQSVDQNGDGRLDFQEFLALMRIIQDRADADKCQREHQMVEACKFERQEVAEFRKVFQMFDMDASGDLSYEEFADMIGEIVPIKGKKKGEELRHMLAEVTEDGDRALDFPQFLKIMHEMQEHNWQGINDTCNQRFSRDTTESTP